MFDETVLSFFFYAESNDHNGSSDAHSHDSWKLGFSSAEPQLEVDAANVSDAVANNTVLRKPATHARRVPIENMLSQEEPLTYERPGNTQEFPCFITDQQPLKPQLEICHEQSESEATGSHSKQPSSGYFCAQSDLSIITGATGSTYTTFDETPAGDDVSGPDDVTSATAQHRAAGVERIERKVLKHSRDWEEIAPFIEQLDANSYSVDFSPPVEVSIS